ncbi:MAG: filamentous hemagglutinin N-terminal domain-containing protein, partial [Polaromonas sp.]|uniref:two-partner secretion domain-containing protein n=1 Tax=Polaromonas sp. TaxID=1869339 RepID=UPI0025EA5662
MTSTRNAPPSAYGKRRYRPWSVRTVVIRLSRKLTATYRIRTGRSLSFLLSSLLALVSPLSRADLPTGGVVVAGQATVSTPTANSMRIDQATDKAALNWQTFNIGTGQSVQFVQPAATSVALNRVIGNDASSIYGSLNANGQVFLINPSGVMFAPGAQVSVGGLVASSLAISNDDFMAGRYTFSGIGGGPVDNHGNIDAKRGGYVLLAAPKVGNTGTIRADAGSVGLLAGNRATIDTSGTGLVRFSVDAAAANAAVVNSGNILADGGQIALLASSVGDAMATVINQTGVVRANTATERDGMIVLSGGPSGVVRVAGQLTASGAASGQSGGTIKVLGDKVALESGARLDASGQAGGGTVLVGGNYQGKGTEQNASLTLVAQGAAIDVSAASSGNGGKAIVWADGATGFYGDIKATGGAQSGNGGFAEVSGKQNLAFDGTANLSAANGQAGTLLLDPLNIIVAAAGAAAYADVSTFAAQAGTTQTVSVGTLNAVAGNITLQATNDITVSSAFAVAANKSVSMEANNNITVSAALSTTGTGAINLKADADASGVGALAINAGVSSQAGGITLSGASVTSNAAGTINATGAASANAGNVEITSAGAVTLAAAVTATGGTAGAGTVGRNAGTVSITGTSISTGAITASGSAGNGAGQAGGTGGTVNLTSTGGLTTGTITASGGAGGTGNSAGGSAGSITLANSGTGNISTGALIAQTGNAVGAGAGGTAGSVSVTNTAAGSLSTGAITTTGGTMGHGGNVSLSALGTAGSGNIAASGGAALATNAGRNAGTVSITGAGIALGTSTITASGTAGVGASQAGGNGNTITL